MEPRSKKKSPIDPADLLQGVVIVAELGEAVFPSRRGVLAVVLVAMVVVPPRRVVLGAERTHGRLA